MKKHTIPFYPIVIAAFPTLALFAYNTLQARFTIIIRPLLISILFGLLLLGIAALFYQKKIHKAALITGITIILFFSYGHVYSLINSIPFFNTNLGRNRCLIPIYGLIFLSSIILTRRKNITANITRVMNLFSVILIAFPLIQTGSYYFSEAVNTIKTNQSRASNPNAITDLGYSPDVYYIVLDAYSRPDVLLDNYNLDMRDFIEEMEELGFFYASESHSNYNETFASLSSSLNLNFISDILEERGIEPDSPAHRDLIIHNEVRDYFESIGYQTVAFSTGYKWTEMHDADIYHEVFSSFFTQSITPFEAILIRNLIIYPFNDHYLELFNIDVDSFVGSQHNIHIKRQKNLLTKLPETALNKNPTFTFAHVLIPHPPYVFDMDGSILDDPGYYSGEGGEGINETYTLQGYKKAVKFISQQIYSISKQILENSESEPIIIIQSDHGWKEDNRFSILNLYYFPDRDYEILYPSISPVNSFRIVLSTYFNEDYHCLEDSMYDVYEK